MKMLSVLLISYYRLKSTVQCLQSLGDNTSNDFEVVLVDNGSDASVQKGVKNLEQKFPWLSVYLLPKNVGRCQGLKYAFERSKGDYIALFDPDMIVTKDWDTRAVNRLVSVDGAGCVGLRVIENHKVKCFSRKIIKKTEGQPPSTTTERVFDHSLDSVPQTDIRVQVEEETDLVHDGAVVYKREVFEKLEFCPEYFLGLAGLDFLMQVRKFGFKVLTSTIDVLHYPCLKKKQDPMYYALRRGNVGGGYLKQAEKVFCRRWNVKP